MFAAALMRRRRLAAVTAGTAVAALALTGCAAGQVVETLQETPVVDGTAFQAGQIDLRNVGVEAPSGSSYKAGSSAVLQAYAINNGKQADQLVSVSSPDATQVVFYRNAAANPSMSASASGSPGVGITPSGNAPSPSTSPSGSATVSSMSPSASPSSTTTGSATSSATLTPAAGASSSASPSASGSGNSGPLTSIPIPADQAVDFGFSTNSYQIVLVGLKRQLFPAMELTVTFTFANNGPGTHAISVKLPLHSTHAAPTITAATQATQ